MTVVLFDRPELLRLVESGNFVPAQHPRGPDGRFTQSFAALMSPGEKGRARRAAAAFQPRRGVATPDGARGYLSGIGKTSPATATYFAGGHADVNQALRAGKSEYPGVKAMDDAMVELPDDILVTRRVPARMLGDVTPEQLVGFKVADAGYTAGSLTQLDGGPGDVIQHIAVPKGTRVAINPDNGAIVLDRGLEQAVLHVASNGRGGKDMYLTVMPKGDGDTGPDGHASADGPGGNTSGRNDAAQTSRGSAPNGTADSASSTSDTVRTASPDRSAADTSATSVPADTGSDSSTSVPDRSGGDTQASSTASAPDTGGVLQRANATDEPASLGNADPQLHDAIHSAFDFQSGSLTAALDDQVSQIYRDGDGKTVVRAEGYIRNKDGKVVGSFRRVLYPETGEVHNDTLALSGSEQGSGFAQQFATRSEPLLAEMGLTHATVSATGVGGYAWRRYGWDPDSVNAKGDVPDRLQNVAAKYDLAPEDKATLAGWLKAFQQPDQSQWPTPTQIGNFGKGKYTRKDDAGRDVWPGKEALVNSAWQGRRSLKTGQQTATEPA